MSTALALAALLALAPGGRQDDAGARALQLNAAGEYARAYDAAGEIADPLARAQTEVWVLYSGGLLDEALRAAERALRTRDDAWLRARAVELAVTLHDAPTAVRHLSALEEAPDTDAAGTADLREAARELADSEAARERALRAARLTTFSLLGACAAALAWLARSR